MTVFLIKILSSSMNQFIHPRGGKANPGDGTALCRHQDIHDRMYWRFEREEGDYGYIRHNASGMYVVPQGGSENPGQRTLLVLTHTKMKAALFKFDLGNNEIIHKGGRNAATAIEPVGDFIDLGSKPPFPFEIVKFGCVATNDQGKRINPYE